jgi:hypothetical protein
MHEFKINGQTHLIEGHDLLTTQEICFYAEVSATYLKAMKRSGFVMVKRPGKRSHFATFDSYLLFHKLNPGFKS